MCNKLILLVMALSVSPSFAEQVYKCVDNGKITFSDAPCRGSNARISVVNATPNSITTAEDRARMDRAAYIAKREKWAAEKHRQDRQLEYEREDEARKTADTNKACQAAQSSYTSEKYATAGRDNARTLQGMKQDIVKTCGASGLSAVIPPAPAHQPSPSTITTCDKAGCWDNLGGHYSRGGGGVFIKDSGQTCQNVGGMMECN